MSDDNDQYRTIRAALSQYVGGALPADLTATAQAHGLTPGSWVYPADATPITAADREDLAAQGLELRLRAEDAGVVQLVPGDPGWPAGTGCDLLPCLWVSGDTDIAGLLRQAVTVTGSRAGSAYGQHVASDIAYALANYGWTVVTGVAVGIDTHAVRAALAAGRPPLLIAGNGLDRSYAMSTAEVLTQVAEHGAVVSAFPPGCAPTRARWAVQERLLGMLTAATVVVEASSRSRALRTAQAAAGSGRTVCAVPGPVTSATSAGCHQLLADGTARLVTRGFEIIAAVAAPAAHTGQPGTLYQITATVSWDDGVWHSRQAPTFFVEATSHRHAADKAHDVVFTANPRASGATLDAGVVGPGGVYESVQITTTS